MYKIILGIIAICTFVTGGAVAEAFVGGTGTPGDPYQISTCTHLQNMSGSSSASYVLVNNVDCSESETWNGDPTEWENDIVGGTLIPDSLAGVTNNGYSGFLPVVLNGGSLTSAPSAPAGGYTISNLWIFRKNTDDVGLFSSIINSTISNVKIDNARVVGGSKTGILMGTINVDSVINDITISDSMARAYLNTNGGGLAGYVIFSNIDDITITDTVVHGSGNVIGGLFGYADDATISDIVITNVAVDGGNNIGGAIGYALQSIISNVQVTGTVLAEDAELTIKDRIENVGGVVGRLEDSSVASSTFQGTVSINQQFFGSGHQYIGGFAGNIRDNSTVTNARVLSGSTVTLDGTNPILSVGGFAGTISDSDIETSFSRAPVIAVDTTELQAVGGFAGEFYDSELSDSYATGNVVGSSAVGGMFGNSGCDSQINRSYATGNVTAVGNNIGGFTGNDSCEGPGSTMSQVFATGNVVGDEQIGGFVGSAGGTIITDAYAAGTVTGSNDVGGFGGTVSESTIENAYARGLVVGSIDVGGFIGDSNDNIITASYWDISASNQAASAGGDGLATLAMKNSNTFTTAGWNFISIWGINPNQNSGYPFFRYQGFTHNDVPPPIEDESRRSSGGGSRPRTSQTTATGAAEVTNPVEVSSAVQTLILQNRALFERAKALGIQLPEVITRVLGSSGSTTTLPVRDLFRGMSGDDVRALQALLIAHNAGPKAQALARITATGEFVNYTEEALIEYQQTYGIVPATGYFGAITRAQMKAAGLPGLWW